MAFNSLKRRSRLHAFALKSFLAAGAAAALSGCQTLAGGPVRIYSQQQEMMDAKARLQDLEAAYYQDGIQASKKRLIRNEVIFRRMLTIDVNYSEYELSLTQERQLAGFGGATLQQGLSIAGNLVTPVQTGKILNGIAQGVGAAKGFYDSELVMAKTIPIVLGSMRAQRDIVARAIMLKKEDDTEKYPLSLALGDVEDYYLAGTFSSGLAKALEEAGAGAADAKALRIAATLSPTPEMKKKYVSDTLKPDRPVPGNARRSPSKTRIAKQKPSPAPLKRTVSVE
jgi:hypothetical protein